MESYAEQGTQELDVHKVNCFFGKQCLPAYIHGFLLRLNIFPKIYLARAHLPEVWELSRNFG
jgi:hypothetical protein